MPILNYTTTVSADKSVQEINLPQLRMQALNTACDFELFSEEEGKATLSNAMKVADQIVHYCLTGEHQLPEEKE